MKIFQIVIIIYALSLIIGCNKKTNTTFDSPNQKKKVGLVFDVGGKGDKSFNDAAFKGLVRAKKELGIDFEVIEPGDGSDRESALRKLASKDEIGIVFAVGFIFTDDITAIAKDFPNKKFGCVDYSVASQKEIPVNLTALEFKEDEGSFLVGTIAAMLTKTNTVGFLGGMESALIKKFETGYRQGIEYINPKIKILSSYVSVSSDGFKNPGKGKEIALSEYNSGADIIYHASGLSGVGLFEAAREMKKFAIGVDLDQYNEAPGVILTSMIKLVDEVIFQTIKDYSENKFIGGVKTLGLKEKGVDYIYDNNNKNLIPEDVRKKVEDIKSKIISGDIKIKN
ncbi:MAG TPA: BMP family ABC transporter substrate-binding protein [Ignavibacteria bacterium]